MPRTRLQSPPEQESAHRHSVLVESSVGRIPGAVRAAEECMLPHISSADNHLGVFRETPATCGKLMHLPFVLGLHVALMVVVGAVFLMHGRSTGNAGSRAGTRTQLSGEPPRAGEISSRSRRRYSVWKVVYRVRDSDEEAKKDKEERQSA